MGLIAFLLALVGWIWSIRAGISVGLLCAVLNFLFPPLAQMIFSAYEPEVRVPTVVLLVGLALMALNGKPGQMPVDTTVVQAEQVGTVHAPA
ncbi:MAG: hypothetical protein K0S16_623 [Moraxellaceae bacterium]|jgi:hypothetical protein|nr:hypothetical protein [Moraxellaceae bacterium]